MSPAATSGMLGRPGVTAPLPLVVGFALFLAALVWLVGASLTRRAAPTFAITPAARARAAGWATAGDTLTLDATDAGTWRRTSLSLGRALAPGEPEEWELAVRRHHITVEGEVADLGEVPFETARPGAGARFVPSRPGEDANEAIRRWYDYSFVTHLLETKGRVYALRSPAGGLWKVQVLSYYCPGLVAGCLTIRYAPLAADAAPTEGMAAIP